jgi:thiol-disulfide isomerase/thioredoxin
MTFTTIDGTQRKLSEFHGQKVMLWFFATWCTSCQAGAQALAKNFDQLRAAGVQIIQLKLYNNLGYPGPSVAEFAQKFIGPAANSSSWLLGDASEAGSYRYDARGYPDIYFLLSKDSTIQAINGVPDTTMEQILTFAHQSQ